MSATFTNVVGDYHLIIKLKGTPSAISLYHRLMRRCDTDWPWRATAGNRICEGCMGILYRNPRIPPEDIKVGARQAGVHVKIKSFHPESVCCDSSGVAPLMWVNKDIIDDMILPGGIDRLRKMLVDLRKPHPIHTITLPPGTERVVHDPSVGPVIHGRDGSLIQLPTDLTSEELEELESMGGLQ